MAITQCIFCGISGDKILFENDHAFAFWDAFPVTPLHLLVVPKRHTPDYFSITRDELAACDSLLRAAEAMVREQDPTVEGFNVGSNAGAVAGQTVFHCHFHLIPRRKGDVGDPRGGVRNVIPNKGPY
jgi:diadenosine tetraphosphate (Ap4A) HIT family hydrolase